MTEGGRRYSETELAQEYTLATRTLVMYPHLNAAGRLFGGLLVSWIDEAGALVAGNIMRTRRIATKKLGEVIFDSPGWLGDVVEIWCKPSHLGRTSLTLDCLVVVRRESADGLPICRSSVVYVAIDDEGRPKPWRRETG